MKICIDPGHGGTDPGTSGSGIKEKSSALCGPFTRATQAGK
ncbi:N-acetylmuramoyl-L-alanine amidase [bacterium]|nr:N-acetylmuramoyl-L-alanine amidase [bacterium]